MRMIHSTNILLITLGSFKHIFTVFIEIQKNYDIKFTEGLLAARLVSLSITAEA